VPYFQSELGHKVYYEQHGQVGPVIILIHGLGSSTRIWVQQIQSLKKHSQVLAFDFPGHGQSDWQEKYSIEELCRLVLGLMQARKIETASLAGLSLGCSVALIFAIHYPERVEKLILESPIGGYHKIWNPLGWLDQIVFRLLPLTIELAIRLFGAPATVHWLDTFGVKKMKRNFKVLEAVQQKVDPRALRDLLWDSASTPYTGKLNRITAPVLLIRGCDDPFPKRFVTYIRTHLHQVTYVEVPETRHLVAMEKPEEFNRLVFSFLKLSPLSIK
jgi:pimeloyl-ACP methyl ester carboxylesterase